jgi:hypothetical protein
MLAATEFIATFPSTTQKLKIKIHKIIILPVVLYGCGTWSYLKGRAPEIL